MAKKIIIIGSGFGGLASAIRLRAKGYDVTLLEKHPDLGGRARVFRKGNFIYDGGPTVITAPYLLEELFSLFNKNISDYVKIVPLDLWYRFVFSNGQTFDYSGDENSMKREVRKFSEKDFDGYNNLVNFTEKIFNKGFSDLSDKPFNDIGFMVKQIPSLLKLKSYKSVYKLVSNYISSEKLRRVFSMHLFSRWKSFHYNFDLYFNFIFRKKVGHSLLNGWDWQCCKSVRTINDRRKYQNHKKC